MTRPVSTRNLISAVSEPPAIDGLTTLIEETGIDDFIDRTPRDRPFWPTMEHGFGLCFRLKEYEPEDPYIQDHGVRKMVSKEAQGGRPSQSLKWVESIGVADIGGGAGVNIPVAQLYGGYVSVYGGLYGSLMLRFRRLELEVDGQHNKERVLPTSASEAMKMKAGSEIELLGQGKLNTGAGLMVGAGVDVSQFSVGAAIVVPVTFEGVKEYSVTITALDGNGRVRVILRRFDSKQKTTSLMAIAGLISPGFNGPDLTPDGAINLLAGNTSTVNSTNLMLDYTSAGIQLTVGHVGRSTVISAFDLDLNKPDAAQAYNDMIRLSPCKAFDLAKEKGSGVWPLSIKEEQSDVSASAAFNFFGEKLFLWENVESDRQGTMVRRNGTQLKFKEKIFEKHSRNVFTGRRNISWEAATFEDEGKAPALFFHLAYERSDGEFVKTRFDRFMRFAETLGVPTTFFDNNSDLSVAKLSARFFKAAKVDTKVDLYFSNAGVENIERCDTERAVIVYLRSVADIHPKYRDFPCLRDGFIDLRTQSLLRRYSTLHSPSHFFGAPYFRESEEIRAQYLALTGRKIEKDARLFKEAEEFGAEVHRLKHARGKGEADHFFSRLGKMRGFRFMATITALRTIAGSLNTYVHELSLSGLGYSLAYNSEVIPRGPRDLIYEELTAP